MDFSILMCPVTKNGLNEVNINELNQFKLNEEFQQFGKIDKGLIDSSNSYFYPIFNNIIVLLPQYALYVGNGSDNRSKMIFDKKRVFDYYNQINFEINNSLQIYGDWKKWVDDREVSKEYSQQSFSKASKYYPKSGKYFLDIASGPVSFQEYMDLSNGYEYRICIDISINALIQAQFNIEKNGKKGIFICGDISNIPIIDNICDTVISQHTLYHIPKNEQKNAVNELYRVAKPNSKIVIIYSWFYHSWMMNLTLNIFQLYRITRHLAGKVYVKFFKTRPIIYFYAHSPSWFKKSFEFSNDIEFFSWRSTNINFLKIYIHEWLWGKQILKWLSNFEDKHSRFMGTFGDYVSIVITKKDKLE